MYRSTQKTPPMPVCAEEIKLLYGGPGAHHEIKAQDSPLSRVTPSTHAPACCAAAPRAATSAKNKSRLPASAKDFRVSKMEVG